MSSVIAILCADLHISEKAPVARSAEPDWFEAQARSLGELRKLSKEHIAPVICAGDVFDSWRASPATINFALKELPERFYAIPGQHDLPNHNYDEIGRSAYWTLVLDGMTGNIEDCRVATARENRLVLYGFPWGEKLERREVRARGKPTWKGGMILHIAVVHAYCWKAGTEYPGAPKMEHADYRKDSLLGYDVVLFGDNHKGFLWKGKDGPTIFNAGTFFRRRSDEIDYRPMVGLLHKDGKVEIHHLDVSQDKFLDEKLMGLVKEARVDLGRFVKELRGLGDSGLDFREALLRFVETNDCEESVRTIIRAALEVGE